MISKINSIFRILTIILSFFFLTGFVPILSFVGPSITALTSGSIYKASAQFMVNQQIEKETGKTLAKLGEDFTFQDVITIFTKALQQSDSTVTQEWVEENTGGPNRIWLSVGSCTGTCIRPDIFLSNNKSCDGCEYHEFCLCRNKRLSHEKRRRR